MTEHNFTPPERIYGNNTAQEIQDAFRIAIIYREAGEDFKTAFLQELEIMRRDRNAN